MTSLRIVYAGTPEFAVPALQGLLASRHKLVAVYTQPDRPAGRGRVLTAGPVKQCALAHRIPVEQPLNFRSEEAIQRLQQYQADIMVVAAYGLILPQTVLNMPRHGCVNIHASLLPRWRGAAPVQRAILAGDKRTGVTLMRMEAGLDTGPMLDSVSVEIGVHDSAAELQDRLAILGASQLIKLLENAPASLQQTTTQPEAGIAYAKKISKDEARIDWHQSAEIIDRQIRAFNPWPVADTLLSGKQLRLWQAAVLDIQTNVTPGTVIQTDASGIQVACGEQVLNITQLQLAGRNVMNAADFIKAHTLTGQCLGRVS